MSPRVPKVQRERAVRIRAANESGLSQGVDVKLGFSHCSRSVSTADLDDIQRDLGVKLPQEFRAHYETWNGGDPNKSLFRALGPLVRDIEITHFFSFRYNHEFADDPEYTLAGIALEEWAEGEVPTRLLPFAVSYDGNYLCSDLPGGQIYYYIRDNDDSSMSKDEYFAQNSVWLAESFEEFLGKLECPDSVPPVDDGDERSEPVESARQQDLSGCSSMVTARQIADVAARLG